MSDCVKYMSIYISKFALAARLLPLVPMFIALDALLDHRNLHLCGVQQNIAARNIRTSNMKPQCWHLFVEVHAHHPVRTLLQEHLKRHSREDLHLIIIFSHQLLLKLLASWPTVANGFIENLQMLFRSRNQRVPSCCSGCKSSASASLHQWKCHESPSPNASFPLTLRGSHEVWYSFLKHHRSDG